MAEVIEVHKGQTLAFPGLDALAARAARARTRHALASAGVSEAALAGVEFLVPLRACRADLAITVAGLVGVGRIAQERVEGVVFFGELRSDSTLMNPRGLLPCVLAAARAGVRRAIVPADGAEEASLVENIEVLVAHTFGDVARYLLGEGELRPPHLASSSQAPGNTDANDVADLTPNICSPAVIRALTIAAAGGHAMLLVGAPGSARGRVAGRMTTLLPPMTSAERFEVASIHSLALGAREKGPGSARQKGPTSELRLHEVP